MKITKLLLFNLRAKYGNLVVASSYVGIKASTLQNWANGYSNPHLGHLEIIAQSSKINGSYWIRTNFLNLSHKEEFTQTKRLHDYFVANVNYLMANTGRRRRDFEREYNSNTKDGMSLNTFDGYRAGRITNIPLHRLEELGRFFQCDPYKLIEVKNDEEKK